MFDFESLYELIINLYTTTTIPKLGHTDMNFRTFGTIQDLYSLNHHAHYEFHREIFYQTVINSQNFALLTIT